VESAVDCMFSLPDWTTWHVEPPGLFELVISATVGFGMSTVAVREEPTFADMLIVNTVAGSPEFLARPPALFRTTSSSSCRTLSQMYK
jgi:hypothetical protein